VDWISSWSRSAFAFPALSFADTRNPLAHGDRKRHMTN
jgi:hypothetical protein